MKQGAMQFEIGDWLRDPQLSMCTPATRGIWFDLLCVLHELGRSGQVTGTPEQLCRACRCTPAEFVAAIAELSTTGTADIHNRNGNVTVINRRMQREHKERLNTAERVKKYRSNGDVTEKKRERNKEAENPRNSHIDIHVTTKQKSLREEKDSTEELRSSVVAKKPKREKPPPDERSKHPAITACKSIVGRYPDKALYDQLIRVLGEQPDLLKMHECREEWVKRGYNPSAWTWAMDWYKDGIPPRNGAISNHNSKRGNDGNNSKPPANASLDKFKAAREI